MPALELASLQFLPTLLLREACDALIGIDCIGASTVGGALPLIDPYIIGEEIWFSITS